MNTYYKLCPNVWLAKCDDEHQKGDVIQLTNRHGKEADVEVFNRIILRDSEHFYYSFVRCEDKSYAERKSEKYGEWSDAQEQRSVIYHNASKEGKDFLSLAEPIKIGHHSEKRHRALIERNYNRMAKSVEASKKAKEHRHKAEYWAAKADEINLSMPESLEYFKLKLDEAIEIHRKYKSGEIERDHSYSLTYAKKAVKEIQGKVDIAEKLWGGKND